MKAVIILGPQSASREMNVGTQLAFLEFWIFGFGVFLGLLFIQSGILDHRMVPLSFRVHLSS